MEIQRTTTIPEVNRATVILRELSADEKIKAEAFYREKRLHDEATALGSARREGHIEGRKEGLIEGKKEGLIEGKKEGLIEGKKEGKKERDREIAEVMLKNGYTKEQIDAIFCGSDNK